MKNKLLLLMLAVCIGNLGGCTEKPEADASSTENTESVATKKEEIVPGVSTDKIREAEKQEDKIEGPGDEVEHKSYIVKEGDWLMNIAREICGDSKLIYEIYEMNQETISNPDFIYPGQILILPNN
ncbi:hypothetical protein AN643_02180 [Candidatus Epulonipiscioides saccharophilum]|nr:hypothetical protein AN643_02180 [Epulopiscium sp. SCG-B10WGA-EpuloB]